MGRKPKALWDLMQRFWGGIRGGTKQWQATGAHRQKLRLVSSLIAAAVHVICGTSTCMPDLSMLSSKQKFVKFKADDALSNLTGEQCEKAIAFALNYGICGAFLQYPIEIHLVLHLHLYHFFLSGLA